MSKAWSFVCWVKWLITTTPKKQPIFSFWKLMKHDRFCSQLTPKNYVDAIGVHSRKKKEKLPSIRGPLKCLLILSSKMKFCSYWVFHAHTKYLINKHIYVLNKIEATLVHNEVPIVVYIAGIGILYTVYVFSLERSLLIFHTSII